MYVPLENYSLVADLITEWEVQPFPFHLTLCSTDTGYTSSPTFWVDGHESSQALREMSQKEESFRK